MKLSHWTICATLVIALWLLSMAPTISAVEQQLVPSVDLASLPDNSELTTIMRGVTNPRTINNLNNAINFNDWLPITPDTLSVPRQNSTLWLTATVRNSSHQALTRWLVIEPWRVHRIDAFFIDPLSGDTLDHAVNGVAVPATERSINNGKAVIPVHLNAGETQQIIFKVFSDSLPFMSITSWDPVAYSQNITKDRLAHIALLAGIITLLLILVLQFNAGLMITSLWLLVAFIFESEKDGFVSYYLLNSLEDYAFNLRASTWVLTEQLFLTTSVFLLGLSHSRPWRAWIIFTALTTGLLAYLTFVLDGNQIRQWGIILTSIFAISWPFIIVPALRIKRPQQTTLLLLLAIYWMLASFLLLGYIFNFYYSSAFNAARVYIEIAVALALILTYSWQNRSQLKQAELTLKFHEAHSRQQLEHTVEHRTVALNNALDTAQKANQAKVNFLGQVSHDLRSPLIAILGYAQLQEAGVINEKKASEIILDRASYMKSLVDGLVDYAKDTPLDSHAPQELYLIAFIDNLVNQAHLLAHQHNNRFQLKINTELPTLIQCNYLLVQRVLLNLLDNAAKYTHEGYTSLAIAVTTDAKGKPALQFCVTDTGRGMTQEQLNNAFTPFYQGPENTAGSGVGLAVCLDIVEQLGGKLSVTSDPNQGTKASCIIPYLPSNELLVTPALPNIQDLLPTFDAQGKTIWIVESAATVRDLLSNELSELGFKSKVATHAEGFIETLKLDTDEPALIITDYYLPGASGLEVLRSAREYWPNVPVILLSTTQSNIPSSFSTQTLQHCAYLAKPINLLELRLTIAKLCHVQQVN